MEIYLSSLFSSSSFLIILYDSLKKLYLHLFLSLTHITYLIALQDLTSTSSSLILQVVSDVVTSRFTERYFSSSGSQIWILVGLISCVVGLACFALSPSSIYSTAEWTAWKFFINGVFITGYLITILFAEWSLRFLRNVWNQIKAFPTCIQVCNGKLFNKCLFSFSSHSLQFFQNIFHNY